MTAGRTRTSEDHIRKAYAFLVSHEKQKASFTKAELADAAGWKRSTVNTHLSKKLSKLVHREVGQTLRAMHVSDYTEDEFLRLMSQLDDVSADPRKPRLKPEVESLVRKARESALLAVQIYNNPTIVFRTEGFSVMMVIGWTALLHAIFEKRGQPYLHLDPTTGKPITVDGEPKAWELKKCVDEFFGSATTPVRKNLEFFIGLRNKIEHRFVPQIDPEVSGECQALLLNFDELLVDQFGVYFAIRDSLAVPLQTANIRPGETVAALKKLQARHFDDVNAFVDSYRASLPAEILGNQQYRFRVYLIPVPANHAGADRAIQFVRITPENAGQLDALTKNIVAIRERPVANAGLLKPTDVVRQVAAHLGKSFNMSHHTRAWRRYKTRRPTAEGDKVSSDGCNPQYCIPDPVHNDYVYTPAWVDFLVKTLSDDKEYAALTCRRTPEQRTKPG